MEFLFRPIERWLEGGRIGSMGLDERRGLHPRRLLKVAIFGLLSIYVAHVFLAYFVGVDQLVVWVTRSPIEHPTSFLVMSLTTLAMFLDFAWFREQTCLVACPYGRLQSALLDRRSLIVGYDTRRGEPRMRGTKERPEGAGDCIACQLCVIVCPTGIDIRDGLQMECIHCTQCIDACDVVMEKTARPKGLIRYGARDEFEGKPRRILRPRIVIYPLILVFVWGGLVYALAHRGSADVTVLRGIGAPYGILPDGQISNQLRVKIVNRSPETRRYTISIADAADLTLVSPDNPLEVGPGAAATASVFVMAQAKSIPHGLREIEVAVKDGAGFERTTHYRLLGPEE
jgi:cytochrome c oxidase accessory protein FixG